MLIYDNWSYHLQYKCPCIKIAVWPCKTIARHHSLQYIYLYAYTQRYDELAETQFRAVRIWSQDTA